MAVPSSGGYRMSGFMKGHVPLSSDINSKVLLVRGNSKDNGTRNMWAKETYF